MSVYHEDVSGLKYPRPKLEQALQALEEGEVDAIIAHVEDRLNRHEINGFLIRKRILDASGELHYTLSGQCELGDEYRMFAMIKDAIAANEVRTITERMQRGKRHKAKGGAWIGLGKPPYGYCVVGEGRDMRLEPLEEEARWVRQVFEWYAYDKIGVQRIVERLREMGVARPGASRAPSKSTVARATEWNVSGVYRILKNETYVGHFYAYRWKQDGKRGRVERPREEWIEIPVPSLVDDDLFMAAELRLSTSRSDIFRKRRYEYLMATRLTCGYCGLKIGTMPANQGQNMYYRCYTYRQRERRETCSLPLFKVKEVDTAIWNCIKSLVRNADEFRAAVEESRAKSRQDHSHYYDAIAHIEAEIKHQQSRLEQAVRLFLDNQGEDKRFIREAAKREQDEANEVLSNLHRERDLLSRKIAEVQLSDDTLDAINAYVADLRDGLDEMTLEEQRSVVDALGATARLTCEDGRRVAYLTVLLREERIEFENGSLLSLYSRDNLKPMPPAIPLTFRLVLAA